MTSATSNRNTRARRGDARGYPVAAGVRLWAGTFACVTTAGLLVPGAADRTLRVAGVTERAFDNRRGVDGAITGEVEAGVRGPFPTGTGADVITAADIDQACYLIDDQTVARTDGSGTRPAAGSVYDVTPEGVWVRVSLLSDISSRVPLPGTAATSAQLVRGDDPRLIVVSQAAPNNADGRPDGTVYVQG